METKILTLCLLKEGDKILLGMKKRGFGVGWWNGFGGKLHEGESLEEAAHREMLEESGIIVKQMVKKGILYFEFIHEKESLEVHVFQIEKYEGEPVESEEMKPQWFNINEIPFAKMWPDDIYWLPLFLEGKMFKGHFSFLADHKMLSHRVNRVDNLD